MSKTKLVPFSIEKAQSGGNVVTRNGYPVKVLTYSRKSFDDKFPIIALVEVFANFEDVIHFQKDGSLFGANIPSEFDLFLEEFNED